MGVSHTERKKSNADKAMDFIMVIVSSTAAPLLSHILNTLSPHSEWDTDRLVILYFASLSGFIIADKIRRLAEGSTKFGFLNYSDAIFALIWCLPVTIVVFFYEYTLALYLLVCYFAISFAVLRRDWDVIQIDYSKLLLIAIITLIMIWIGSFYRIDSSSIVVFLAPFLYLGVLVVTSYLFDKLEIAIINKRGKNSITKESK